METTMKDKVGEWTDVGHMDDFPRDAGIAVLFHGEQVAVFHFAERDEWYACQNMCPHREDMVLARGLTGDKQSKPFVACPMHKKAFALEDGACLNDPDYSVKTYAVKIEDSRVKIAEKEA